MSELNYVVGGTYRIYGAPEGTGAMREYSATCVDVLDGTACITMRHAQGGTLWSFDVDGRARMGHTSEWKKTDGVFAVVLYQESSPPRTITIGDKVIPISEESFQALKRELAA